MAYRTEKLTPFELLLWGRNNKDKEVVKVTTEAGQTFRVHYLPPESNEIRVTHEMLCNLRGVTK